ncbi:Purple acid phosphatase 3 [Phytophthora cinnamomi]|uniref:Purple acid phosphatase 3 n=1 Tax=Phytophthora cinnamomi TaxID=4785 RepID=UPI00355A98FF|nr:Purple acid phosphatase 3 [Phytophthora cinnamomi]
MGAELSKPAEPNPCAGEMDAYVKCVEAKNAESGGLRDGEECEQESEAYRECRRKVKELKAAVQKQER